MLKKVEGFILTETPNGETNKVLNILTREYGLLGVIAKNVKSIKNPLRTKTTKYIYATFHIDYYENKLSRLEDVDIINSLSSIHKDITTLSYVAYLSELTYQVVKQNFNYAIYDNFIAAILKINEGLNPMIITNILELKTLDYLGVGLNFDNCVRCANKTNIITISPDEGGYICKNCHRNQPLINPKTIKLMRMYYYVKISSITSLSIDPQISEYINIFIDHYYERYTGLYLQSKKFLNSLVKS